MTSKVAQSHGKKLTKYVEEVELKNKTIRKLVSTNLKF
jgi:hypothetical protein